MKKLIKILFSFLLVLVLSNNANSATWINNSSSSTAEYKLQTLIIREHNRICIRNLYQNLDLKSVARWRAKDMIVRNYFSHTIKGTNKKVWDYFYRWNIRWTAAAEIIVWNTYSDTVAADVAYRQFMGSDGHRNIIRSCRYYRVGVGSYKGTTNKRMFAVVFTRY